MTISIPPSISLSLFNSHTPFCSFFTSADINQREYQLINQAAMIDTYHHRDVQNVALLILENMGFKTHARAPFIRLISILNARKVSFESIDKTSELGQVLREFKARERAFMQIALYGKCASSDFFDDVTYPLSRKLRKKARKQVLELIQKSALQSPSDQINKGLNRLDRKPDEKTTGFFQMLLSKINKIAHRFIDIVRYADAQFLTFPSAAAEELFFPSIFSVKDEKNLLELVNNTVLKNEKALKSAQGKKLFFITGLTGVGKGTFINYLFSSYCRHDYKANTIRCDKEVVSTSNQAFSDTFFIEVIETDEKLRNQLGFNVVFVDTPGYQDVREDSPLQSFVYSLSASKYMQELKIIPHINVYVLEQSGISSGRGQAINEMLSLIEREGVEANLIVMSKGVLPKKAIDGFDTDHSSKKTIKNEMKRRGFSAPLIENLILYSVTNAELADECTWLSNKKVYKCSGKGGNSREEVIERLREKIVLAQSYKAEYFLDNTLKTKLNSLAKELKNELNKGFGKDARSSNFHAFNQKFKIFEILLNIKHPALIAIRNEIFDQITIKISMIENNIFRSVGDALDSDDAIINIKSNISWVREFEKIKFFSYCRSDKGHWIEKVKGSHFPDCEATIEKKIEEIVDEKSHQRFDDILKQPTNWENEITLSLLKRIIELADKASLRKKLTDYYSQLEKSYYKSLSTCDFQGANESYSTFIHLKKLEGRIKLGFQMKDLTSFETLSQKYKARYKEAYTTQWMKDYGHLTANTIELLSSAYLSFVGLGFVPSLINRGGGWAMNAKNGEGFLQEFADWTTDVWMKDICLKAWEEAKF